MAADLNTSVQHSELKPLDPTGNLFGKLRNSVDSASDLSSKGSQKTYNQFNERTLLKLIETAEDLKQVSNYHNIIKAAFYYNAGLALCQKMFDVLMIAIESLPTKRVLLTHWQI